MLEMYIYRDSLSVELTYRQDILISVFQDCPPKSGANAASWSHVEEHGVGSRGRRLHRTRNQAHEELNQRYGTELIRT